MHDERLKRILGSTFRIACVLVGPLMISVAWIVSMPASESTAAADPSLTDRARSLEGHVRALCEHGPRAPQRPKSFRAAVDYVVETWQELGLDVRQRPYSLPGERSVANLEVVLPGKDRTLPCLVVGAHYDTVSHTPGADDNASGVAALLELTADLTRLELPRDVRLVAFPCEEPPYFWRETMGSLNYARELAEEGTEALAMLSLESIGYFRSEPGTQKYPPGISLLYPDRGNFIGVVGNLSSRSLAIVTGEAFARTGWLPVESAALPSAMAGIGWSDHWAFWQTGVPAVMITDTAPFRNPHYHRSSDTPETLDYEMMARVSRALPDVIEEVAAHDDYPAFGLAALLACLALVTCVAVPMALRKRSTRRTRSVESRS